MTNTEESYAKMLGAIITMIVIASVCVLLLVLANTVPAIDSGDLPGLFFLTMGVAVGIAAIAHGRPATKSIGVGIYVGVALSSPLVAFSALFAIVDSVGV